MSEEIQEIEDVPDSWFEEVLARVDKDRNNTSLLEVQRPLDAARALWMMSCGVSMTRIGRELKIKTDTIRRLSWRHDDTLQTLKKQFARKCGQTAALYTDLLIDKAEQLMESPDDLRKINPKDLALSMAILTDKSMALSGMAGTIIEHKSGASVSDAAKIIQEAKQRIAGRIKGQAIEAVIVHSNPEE